MPTPYDPNDHIQKLAIAPRAEGILDQREITIQSYQTTTPFDFNAIHAGLNGAWLTPVIRFGVFSRSKDTSRSHCTVVLGLQDELSIRAYDYDARRPLWFSWQDVIVDTVNVHYFSDEDGLLRFKATGGGRRITDDLLYDFNATFLHIPKEAVTKRNFDLDKLRMLCFGRFSERLYMLRFADPSGQEYRSIDHALFQSRQYIDPDAERLHEIQADPKVKIESFDSDIEVRAKELAKPIRVRFFISGTSGSLRLRVPNIRYRKDPGTVEERVQLFYGLVNTTENLILDADYYAHLPRSLDELQIEEGLFPDNVDLAPFREVLLHAEAMRQFFQELDLGSSWSHWQPHLRAMNELLPTANVTSNIATSVQALTDRNPRLAASLLTTCGSDAKISRVGRIVAKVLMDRLYVIPADLRVCVEQAILKWAVDQERETWGPGGTIDVAVIGNPKSLDVHFLKYGVDRCTRVPIKDMPQAALGARGTALRSEGVYPPNMVVWRGWEHRCNLTKREMAFLQLGIVEQEVDVHKLMHRKNGLLWKEHYLNAKATRDKISPFMSRLNFKLSEAKPPLRFSFSLMRDADYVSRTDPADAPADSSLT